jgi:GWxTD domain-containing protein
MKKIIIFVFCSIISFSLSAKSLQAYLSYTTFNSPTDGPYIETYLTVLGSSVDYVKKDNGKFQATVEIMMIFKKDGVIKDFKKTNLLSPEIDDTSKLDFTFVDQQRFLLPNGNYSVEIQLSDKNVKDAVPYKTIETLSVDFPKDSLSVSGIQLVESYKISTSPGVLTKNGYDLVPFAINFYPQKITKLTFYSEIYNTDKVFTSETDKFIVNYYIESFETGKYLSDFYRFKKESPKSVVVLFSEFDISALPSGNYNLVIEVKNKENKAVAYNKLFFQRSNPGVQLKLSDIAAIDVSNTFADKIKNLDTLKDYVKSTYPISTQIEKSFAENHVKNSDFKILQQYFYNFWVNRNPAYPEKAWAQYAKEVEKVNLKFKTTIKRGYETDRGRVYLQYGPPNSITESVNEPSAYPYEIWHYYTLNNQKNKKFVFYNTDLVTNDYELLHSDAIGELSDPAWQMKLVKRNTSTSNPDQIKGEDHFGGKSDDYFKNPY